MGRYLGPKEKLARREGVDLGLKGERAINGKSALDRRPYPPGEHGRRRTKESEYLLRLRAKQRAKRTYGLREKQFETLFEKANREDGITGENLMRRLELRLDNVVYRLGLAATRAQARQFVVHRHIQVNGKRVDRPSYAVSPDDVIALRENSSVRDVAIRSTELIGAIPGWLQADPDNLRGTVLRVPEREEIAGHVEERLIVEHYSH